jgi:hypothetical protein
MSSTKSRCEITIEYEILIPFISPLIHASCINMVKPSFTNEIESGDKRHICVSPLEALKNLERDTFMKTT